MASFDFKDLYIKYQGHPTYMSDMMEEDEPMAVIAAKIEMILFTNKGDVLGDPNFGADLEMYLHQTKVSADYIQSIISDQIVSYAPELITLDYQLTVSFVEDPNNFWDVMLIDFVISDLEINAFIS